MNYPSVNMFPRWSGWLINFTDLTDEIIKKFGDTILTQKPDPNLISLSIGQSMQLTDTSIYQIATTDPSAPVGKLTITNTTGAAIQVSHKNYYYNTAKALIDLANQKGIDESQLNSVIPMHYIIIQWQIAYLHEQLCADNIGLNDSVDGVADKFRGKKRDYYDMRMDWQKKITYEAFNTASMQQNFTRAVSNGFDISC